MGKEKTISSKSLMQEFKYEDGSILKVNVVNNKKEGPYKYYFKNLLFYRFYMFLLL